ncbi:MAG: nucleotidyltransferase family protein [Anaerolineales bacterium]|nr:nucleotidyltransferase family protein [Anaerolineales bacterium]
MITSIVLAAGESKRMGEPKMLMDWGKGSVLQTVISTLQASGVSDILVVTGGARQQVESLVGKTVQTIFNKDYANGKMLTSIQIGLEAKKREAGAALICLGDQPQMEERNARKIIEAWHQHRARIIAPSYQKRRGHPWLIARELWDEILNMNEDETMRDFLNKHKADIFYVEVDTPSILQDLDTPEDYAKFKP